VGVVPLKTSGVNQKQEKGAANELGCSFH